MLVEPEQIVEPVVPENPVTPPPVETPPEPPVEAPKETEEAPKPEESAQRPNWVQKRINTLTAQNHDLRRRLEATIQQPPAANTPPPAEEPPKSAQEIDRLAEVKAIRLRQEEKFTESCNKVFEKGSEEYSDFQTAVDNLQLVGALGPQGNIGFANSLVELDNAHKVLHHLGKNPDEASRILSLSPTRMAIELAKLEDKIMAPPAKPVSQTPPPITPVGGSARVEPTLEDKEIPMEEWITLRNKTRKSRQ